MTISFDELGVSRNIIEALNRLGINKPTEVQAKSIPYALQNKDIIAQSQTGSGKTFAYLLPVFQKVDPEQRSTQAIILAPTHELVIQVDKQIKLLAETSGVKITSAAIIGEVNITRQIEKLRDKPQIIVGSAGRILELIKRKKINAQTVKTIVVDEADKLLDLNNFKVIHDVIKTTMRDRQLMVFSANINAQTLSTAKDLMDAPVVIKIDETLINSNITHLYFVVEQRDKIETLRKLLAAMKPQKAFIFINKTEKTQETTLKLQYHKIKAYGIYGQASKEERQKAMDSFRRGDINILVASDIAARGLDIQGVTHIFNLDLPEDAKEYLHRVGRTGRHGNTGTAVSIVAERETELIKRYERDFKIKINRKDVYKGEIVDPARGRHTVVKPRSRNL